VGSSIGSGTTLPSSSKWYAESKKVSLASRRNSRVATMASAAGT
jgi:hypothetical protein